MVKAVGGFNLACRADKADVVTRLRDLKKRMSKPFAVMVTDVALAEKFCYISAEEKATQEMIKKYLNQDHYEEKKELNSY